MLEENKSVVMNKKGLLVTKKPFASRPFLESIGCEKEKNDTSEKSESESNKENQKEKKRGRLNNRNNSSFLNKSFEFLSLMCLDVDDEPAIYSNPGSSANRSRCSRARSLDQHSMVRLRSDRNPIYLTPKKQTFFNSLCDSISDYFKAKPCRPPEIIPPQPKVNRCADIKDTSKSVPNYPDALRTKDTNSAVPVGLVPTNSLASLFHCDEELGPDMNDKLSSIVSKEIICMCNPYSSSSRSDELRNISETSRSTERSPKRDSQEEIRKSKWSMKTFKGSEDSALNQIKEYCQDDDDSCIVSEKGSSMRGRNSVSKKVLFSEGLNEKPTSPNPSERSEKSSAFNIEIKINTGVCEECNGKKCPAAQVDEKSVTRIVEELPDFQSANEVMVTRIIEELPDCMYGDHQRSIKVDIQLQSSDEAKTSSSEKPASESKKTSKTQSKITEERSSKKSSLKDRKTSQTESRDGSLNEKHSGSHRRSSGKQSKLNSIDTDSEKLDREGRSVSESNSVGSRRSSLKSSTMQKRRSSSIGDKSVSIISPVDHNAVSETDVKESDDRFENPICNCSGRENENCRGFPGSDNPTLRNSLNPEKDPLQNLDHTELTPGDGCRSDTPGVVVKNQKNNQRIDTIGDTTTKQTQDIEKTVCNEKNVERSELYENQQIASQEASISMQRSNLQKGIISNLSMSLNSQVRFCDPSTCATMSRISSQLKPEEKLEALSKGSIKSTKDPVDLAERNSLSTECKNIESVDKPCTETSSNELRKFDGSVKSLRFRDSLGKAGSVLTDNIQRGNSPLDIRSNKSVKSDSSTKQKLSSKASVDSKRSTNSIKSARSKKTESHVSKSENANCSDIIRNYSDHIVENLPQPSFDDNKSKDSHPQCSFDCNKSKDSHPQCSFDGNKSKDSHPQCSFDGNKSKDSHPQCSFDCNKSKDSYPQKSSIKSSSSEKAVIVRQASHNGICILVTRAMEEVPVNGCITTRKLSPQKSIKAEESIKNKSDKLDVSKNMTIDEKMPLSNCSCLCNCKTQKTISIESEISSDEGLLKWFTRLVTHIFGEMPKLPEPVMSKLTRRRSSTLNEITLDEPEQKKEAETITDLSEALTKYVDKKFTKVLIDVKLIETCQEEQHIMEPEPIAIELGEVIPMVVNFLTNKGASVELNAQDSFKVTLGSPAFSNIIKNQQADVDYPKSTNTTENNSIPLHSDSNYVTVMETRKSPTEMITDELSFNIDKKSDSEELLLCLDSDTEMNDFQVKEKTSPEMNGIQENEQNMLEMNELQQNEQNMLDPNTII